jgi:hypothetical protein
MCCCWKHRRHNFSHCIFHSYAHTTLTVQVSDAVPVLAQLLHNRDEEVMTDAAWALSYLTDGDNDKIQAVVESGVVPRLVVLLNHGKSGVMTPALRAVGNIVTGTDSQTQAVIEAGGLQAFIGLLNSPKENLRKETCWTISNITAGTKEQIQSVCDANLIPPLIHITSTAEFRTRKEATWALSNLTSGGTARQVQYIVSQGVIKPLSDLLDMQDTKMLNVVSVIFFSFLCVLHFKSHFIPAIVFFPARSVFCAKIKCSHHLHNHTLFRFSTPLPTFSSTARHLGAATLTPTLWTSAVAWRRLSSSRTTRTKSCTKRL